MQAAFIAATSSALGVAPSSISITSVTALQRRRLTQAGGVQVGFQVFMLSASAASSAATRITAATSSGGSFQAALVAAGVPTTGVALTTAPVLATITAPPQPPSPSPPPPNPPPPAGCGITWSCFAGVSCASASTCGVCPVGYGGDGRNCVPCTLSVAITPSFAGNSTSRSSDTTLTGVVSAAADAAACNAAGGYSFSWAPNALNAAGAPLQLAASSGPSLTLLARSLGSGQTATFTLTACLAAAPATCASNSASFAVLPSPLVALIGGGGGVVGETPVMLSGVMSSDPDGGALTYAWGCARSSDGAMCAARDGTPVALGTAATQTLQLAGGAVYTVTLSVAGSGSRSASTATTLTVQPGAIPLVSVAGSAVLSGAKADPTQQLVLFANAVAFVPGAVVTRWSLAAQSGADAPLLNLSNPAICATPVTSASMVLRPGALAPGARYIFTLSATDAVGAMGLANATVAVSAPATGGYATISPASGIALSTPFVLTASGWTAAADELPLTYMADFIVEGSTAPPVALTNGAFQQSPVIPCQLPAGVPEAGNVVTLRLTVRSAYGATVSTTASATVTWPAFTGAADASAFVDDATSRATAALQSGDSSAALQVVGGLAALLNLNTAASPSTTPSGGGGGGSSSPSPADTAAADAAAAAQRASLLAIVASAMAPSASGGAAPKLPPAAVESTAALVSQLVSAPSQLSGAGAASALSVLSAVASAGSAVSPAAAQSVANALSAVAFAPSSSSSGGSSSGGSGGSGGGNGGSGSSSSSSASSNMGAVLNVLDSLAASQASGMAVPGQAPVSVSTPAIQMSVSLDTADSGRLFDAPLTAPGSSSSFDPLPAGTLAAAGSGVAVSTLFLALSFNPHGGGSSSTAGITRLAFSNPAAGGAAVPVENLTAPLLFTLAASTLTNNTRAQCTWWDASAGNYSGAGCMALPSPNPPGHVVAFSPAFDASSEPASLSRAWNISGPLADGCDTVFLDCTNTSTNATRSLLLGNSTTAPQLSCGNTTTVVLRAFVGDECGLRNASNGVNCSWDLSTQSFAGVGCVTANMTRCACVHATDFASGAAPNIPVCSVADLAAVGNLSPEAFIADLSLLFIVVASLFGGMCVGAAVAAALDVSERRRVVSRLTAPNGGCGYRLAKDGDTRLWRFHLDPLPFEIAAPTGTAVQLASIIGLPFARLRAALPDEFFTSPLCAALGRRHGFSAEGMNAALDLHRELLLNAAKVEAPGCIRTAALLEQISTSATTRLPRHAATPRGTGLLLEGSRSTEVRRSSVWRQGMEIEDVAADVPEDAAPFGKSESWPATAEAGDVFQSDLDAIVPPDYKSEDAYEAEQQMVRARRESSRNSFSQPSEKFNKTVRLHLGEESRMALEEFVGTAVRPLRCCLLAPYSCAICFASRRWCLRSCR